MEWELRFKGKVPPGTVENAKGLIRESFPRRVFGDALGLEIGDILFFLDNYKVTNVPLESQKLLNFTRTPDLDNPNSIGFQRQQSLLCNDVSLCSLLISNCYKKFNHTSFIPKTISTLVLCFNVFVTSYIPNCFSFSIFFFLIF